MGKHRKCLRKCDCLAMRSLREVRWMLRKCDCLAVRSLREVRWMQAAVEHEMLLFSPHHRTEGTHEKPRLLMHF